MSMSMSSSTPDETLSDTTPGAAFGIQDVTEAPNPENFDFDAFLAGARPTRRAVKIHPRADLVGELEELAGEYARLDDAGAKVAEKRPVKERFAKTLAEFHDSAKWFFVEGRSGEWVKAFRERTARELKVTLPDEDITPEDLTDEQREVMRQITLRQAADQVVSPAGVTAEGLAKLGEVNEGELNKVITAVAFANTQIAGAARVVSPGFSLGPSTSQPPPGSRRR